MLPLSKPDIRDTDIEAVNDVLRSGNLVQGKKVEELESEFSKLHNVPYAVAVSNGTAALHLSLLALGVGIGDEVIVTAYSFIASANAIVLTGATPIFCDTGVDSYNMDSAKLKALLTPRTKAILVVHEFGIPANMEQILDFSQEHRIPIVEDAACALGSSINGKRLGTFGILSCFSFHPRKLITCGEGGIILTSNPELHDYLQSMRNHGLDLQSHTRRYISAGFNYRMTDISATLLMSQLSRLETIVERRQEIAASYFEGIVNPGIRLPKVLDFKNQNWQTFPIRLSSEMERERFVLHAASHQISALQPAQFIPSEPFYLNIYGSNESYPNAERLSSEAVALPMYELMTNQEVQRVIEACNEF